MMVKMVEDHFAYSICLDRAHVITKHLRQEWWGVNQGMVEQILDIIRLVCDRCHKAEKWRFANYLSKNDWVAKDFCLCLSDLFHAFLRVFWPISHLCLA